MNLKQLFFLILIITGSFVLGQKGDKIIMKNPIMDSSLTIKESKYKTAIYLVNASSVKYQGGIHYPKSKILKPDMKTFQIVAPFIAKDKDGFYVDGEFMKVDTAGFKFLGISQNPQNLIWKIDNGAYINKKRIDNVNGKDFDLAEGYLHPAGYQGWNTDKKSVYFNDRKVENIDVETFYSINNQMGFDKNGIFKYDEPEFYEGERIKFLNQRLRKTSKYVITDQPAIKTEIDVESAVGLSRMYAKDKDYIYFGEYPLTIPKERFDSIKIWDQSNSSYITDGVDLYFQNKKINVLGFDINTFGMYKRSDYVFDKNAIYEKKWFIQEDGLPEYTRLPFEYSSPVTSENTIYTFFYIVYKNQAYSFLDKKVFKNITPEIIKLLMSNKRVLFEENGNIYSRTNYEHELFEANGKIWYTDQNNSVQTSADAKTFEKVAPHFPYYRDKNMVYLFSWQFGLQEIPEIDVKSVMIQNSLLTDKNYVYYKNYKIVKNEDLEFISFYDGYGISTSQYIIKNREGYWLAEFLDNLKLRFLKQYP